ncbi:MAG: S9 family peptidase [Schleiferiaceae bacterium]|nr:S9 family peptidase [Schleiferiaceae bacterium]
MKKIILGVLILGSSLAFAQHKEITVNDIWKYYRFYASGISGLKSMNDGVHYTTLKSMKNGNAIVKHTYASGEVIGTLAESKDLSKLVGKEVAIGGYQFSADESQILIATETESIYRHSTKSVYYVYNIENKRFTKLNDEKVRYATFSPKGNKVAYVLNNNLFVYDLENGETTTVTNDGKKNHIINGGLDWVYEEEFSFARGFYWSAEGDYIAYYKFDETNVPEFSMDVYGMGLYPEQDVFKYPKAGEENSKVEVWVYQLNEKKNIQVLKDAEYEYIPRLKWTKNNESLCVYSMNRLQNHLQLHKVNATDGSSSIWYEEKDEAYVEISDDIRFLNDGSFIWTSDMSGFNHIYHIDKNGKVKRQVTKGEWDVTSFYGINERKGMLYYQSAEVHPTERNVYSISIKGKGKKNLTPAKGTTSAAFSKSFDYFFSTFSNVSTPTQVDLLDASGKVVREIKKNERTQQALSTYGATTKEFISFKTASDVELNAWMIKPGDFDENKKYPLFMYVYGGPGSQMVTNSYDGFNGMWFQMLAQKGYIVVAVDNRGTGARGRDFKKVTYNDLGKYEVIDQIESAKYLGSLPYIDENRIGIWGWSYGGYMSSNCIFRDDVFKAAIAVAPVTNWKFYDSIYTERYNGLPQDNDAGYEDNSPINHVSGLKGKYLLVHGSADDNVHVQNTMRLVEALVQANKQFDLFIYPDKNHGIFGGNTRVHLYNKMTDFILENL